MVTLYQIAATTGGIVVGTGNKVEDYGVGFYTKYGDGGVDIAPIADLYKTEVWELAESLGVNERIVNAAPTDGLWDDGRTDESQIGASYELLEWVMENNIPLEDADSYSEDERLGIQQYHKFNTMNKHKMLPIPTFKVEQPELMSVKKIGVIGAGRLGICFALLCEAAGYEVLVSDLREDYVGGLNERKITTNEPEVENLLRRAKTLVPQQITVKSFVSVI